MTFLCTYVVLLFHDIFKLCLMAVVVGLHYGETQTELLIVNNANRLVVLGLHSVLVHATP